MINYIIVDDEPIAHKIIQSYAKDLPHLSLKANCYNAMEAMEYLHSTSIDLVFLDINMPKIKGLDFLRMLRNPPAVIVTSAYEEFALEGYELSVTDYLLKPFSFDRFVKAVQKVTQNKPVISKKATTEAKDSIFLKGDKKHYQVKLDDILYIESIGSYCKVITLEETIVTHEKISNFENLLSPVNFFRTHKSFIVSKTHIKAIEGNRILIADQKIPVGQTYKSSVKKILEL